MESSTGGSISGPSYPWPVSTESATTPNRRQQIAAGWMTDTLVYIVVLNLFVEFSPAVVIESFTVSILTAILLKLLLVAITVAKKRVWTWATEKQSRAHTVVGVVGVWAILFLSKFAILGAEDLIFGDEVELGGFLDVVILAAALTVAREAIQRAYLWLGSPA